MERHTTDHHHEKSQLNRLVGGLAHARPNYCCVINKLPCYYMYTPQFYSHMPSNCNCDCGQTAVNGQDGFQQPVNSQSTMKLSQKLVVFFDPTHLLVAYTEQSQCYIVVMPVGWLMNKAGGLGMRLILMVEPILLFFIGCFKKPYQFGLFRCSRLWVQLKKQRVLEVRLLGQWVDHKGLGGCVNKTLSCTQYNPPLSKTLLLFLSGTCEP